MNDSIWIYILGICAFILLVTLSYSWVLHRTTSSKLQQISSKLSQILDQDSDEKIMVFTDDKTLIDLMTQINRMLEDRQRINAEYRKSKLSFTRMLSNISHDIKTPLTVILGYLEMMILHSSDDASMLKKVENKAKQAMELINKFFTLAKIEAGDTDVAISRININEVCKENVIDFYHILSEKNFQVDVVIPERDIFVYGNTDAINRIFFNLISNAIRYGQDGKYLGITLRSDDSSVFIDVTDKGKGIEKSAAANVFDRLYTMEDSRNRQLGGNGLGLAIAKGLAEKLGGDILLDSIPYERTIFTVKLRKMNF